MKTIFFFPLLSKNMERKYLAEIDIFLASQGLESKAELGNEVESPEEAEERILEEEGEDLINE